jgi:CelD/BcsL family acetyltransferase involved in cellulose biosynthesis
VHLERLTLADLEARSAAFDRAVDATPGIDRFCSRVAWIAPFQRAFGAEREPCLFQAGDSFAALARVTWPGGRRGLEPLENMWSFACPLVGPGAAQLLAELTRARGPLAGEPLWLAGLPAERGALRALLEPLQGRFAARIADRTERCVASLAGGLDGFLARRSPAFRRNLRAARRGSLERGLRFERIRVAPERVEALYARVLAIERRSWKALAGNGADRGPMAEFYRAMWPRLAERGALRLVVAVDASGRDAGYVHGGALERRFRGLQFSFDEELRALGLGNLLQLELLDWLCADGFETYDLGSRSEYKQRWAESLDATVALLVVPQRLA